MQGHAPEVVLVTGASGFLGRHVARRFAAEGATVLGLGHGPFTDGTPEEWGLSSWQDSTVSLEALRALTTRPDIIAHCAGGALVGRSFEDPRQDFLRTVATTADILEFIRKDAPAARLVYPSSAAVYGNARALPIAVTHAVRPLSPYGTHKLAAEELCRASALHFGVRCTILRFFSLYGRHLRKQLLWDACGRLSAGSGAFSGTGDELRDFLHVDDAASLFVEGARHATADCPTANGGTGIGTSVGAVIRRLAAVIAPDVEIRFTGAQRPGDPNAFVADVGDAARWGWRPRPAWQTGVDDYALWYRGLGPGGGAASGERPNR